MFAGALVSVLDLLDMDAGDVEVVEGGGVCGTALLEDNVGGTAELDDSVDGTAELQDCH